MQAQDILRYLPHRYPMLLIDQVTVIGEDRATGIKQLTENEWFFQWQTEDPKFPASLLMESMGQAGAAAILARPENEGKLLFLAGMDNVEIGELAGPGQTLEMEAHLLRYRGDSGRVRVTCRSLDAQVATAEFTFFLGSQEVQASSAKQELPPD